MGETTGEEKQVYSDPMLSSATKLLILDASGVIIPNGSRRDHIENLLEYCKNNEIKVVVSTDIPFPKKVILNILDKAHDVKNFFEKYIADIYSGRRKGHLIPAPEERAVKIKNLTMILEEHNISPKNAFMVGDTRRDKVAAEIAGVPYHILDMEKDFDFDSLIPPTLH